MNTTIEIKSEQITILQGMVKKWRISLSDIALKSEYSESMCSQLLSGKVRVTDKNMIIIDKALRLIHDAKERSRQRNEEIFAQLK